MERSPEIWFNDEALEQRPLAVDAEPSRRARGSSNRALAEAVRLYTTGAAEAALRLIEPAAMAGDTDALLLAGQMHFELNRFEEAAADFKQLAQLSPSSRVANFNEGLALAKLRQWAGAIDCLQKSAVRDPDRVEAWFVLAICLLNESRAEEARTCFEQVLKLRPEYVPAWLGEAAALHLAGEHQEAMNICLRLTAAQPEHAELLANALTAALAAGNRAAIAEQARSLLDAQPHHPAALAALASAAIEDGDFARAAACCFELTEAEPDLFEHWYNLACCYRRSGRPADAAHAFGRALELRAEAREALEGRARSLCQAGRYDEAKGDWETLLARATDAAARSAAVAALVLIAIEQGNVSEAVRRRAQAHISDPAVLYKLAWFCQQEGRLDEAALLYREVIDREPGRAEAHLNLAVILAMQGERAQSRELMKTAIRMDSSLAASYFAFCG